MLARSKWVTPRSNARRTIARPVSKSSTSPKLCHRPSETAGNSKPLRPQRLYFIFSYRLSAGLYFTFKLLTKFCVAKRIAGFAFGVKAKSSMLSFVVRIAEAGSALRYVSYIVFRKLSGVCGLADCGLPKRALRFPLRQGLRRDRSLRVRLPFCCYYNPY